MTTPNIVKGQIALDPTNDLLYYVDESSTIIATSLSWVKNNSNISTAENVVISGDLTVSGSTVTVNTETLLVEDNIIVLNTGITGAPSSNSAIEEARNAGIEVERGTSTNVQIRWNESVDKWQLTNDGTNFYDILNSSGITGDLTGNVTGNLTGNSAGTHTGAVVGNADTATKLLNARTISLTGPVTGSVSFDGTSNVSITTLLTAESSGIASLSDVTITSAASGDLLKYNGTAWVNAAGYATLASPTFTGTVSGITATMVGLGSVDNTSDTAKPVSTAQQTALDLKANLASPTFTGTVSGITATMVGLGSVDNTSDVGKPVSTAGQTALNLKANLASPTFTGTVSGITKTMVGLGSVDNTADTAKPVSTAQQTALDLKATLASPTFTGTVTTPILVVDSIEVDTTGATSGQVLRYNGTKFEPATESGPTGPTGPAGPATTDASLLISGILPDARLSSAIARISSPTFTGAPSAPTANVNTNTTQIATTAFVVSEIADNVYIPVIDNLDDLGDVTASSPSSGDLLKWNGTAWVNASGYALLASPALTGTPTAPTAAAATNTTQVATTAFVRAEVAALVNSAPGTLDTLGEIATSLANNASLSTTLTSSIALKAPLASPTFTGTVTIPSGASISGFAPLASPTFTGTVTIPTGSAITLPTVSGGINHSGSTSGTTKLQASDVASGTLTLPAVTGTLVSTGDTGTITSTMIENDSIINADIKSNAGIELGKLADATIDTKTTDHTLVLTDKNKFIKMSVVSSPNTVTVPTNASVEFPIGSQIHIIQYGTGKTQVIPVSGTVIIYSTPGAYLRAQFSSATLLKCDTNIWMLIGDLSAS